MDKKIYEQERLNTKTINKPEDIEVDIDRIIELQKQLKHDIQLEIDILPCNTKGEIIPTTKDFSAYKDKYLILQCLELYIDRHDQLYPRDDC